MGKVICEHAKECTEKCDSTTPNHNVPHDVSIFCRKCKCLATGKIVECVEV